MYIRKREIEIEFANSFNDSNKKTKKIKKGKMNFEFLLKENPRNTILEHCVNKGKNFEVEIVHWKMYSDEVKAKLAESLGSMGNECWNVYATINKGHPLYEKLSDLKDDDYYGVMDKFPFKMHGGITYVHNNGDNIKVGDDYLHWGDEYFQKCKELPSEVKIEAEELFEFLNKYKGE